LAADPEASAIFNAAMAAKAYGQVAGALDAYDFLFLAPSATSGAAEAICSLRIVDARVDVLNKTAGSGKVKP
jgi:hypothetical protein